MSDFRDLIDRSDDERERLLVEKDAQIAALVRERDEQKQDCLIYEKDRAEEIARLQREAREEERREIVELIPTSWLDPLLSGEKAALRGTGPWGCPDIERLLIAIQYLIRARGKRATPDTRERP